MAGLGVAVVLLAMVCASARAQQQTCNDITNSHTISDLDSGATGQIPYTDCNILNGNLFISCTSAVSVEDLEVLRNVERITGSVTIENCKNLENLDGLRSLRYIGGDLTITNNNALQDLQGLERVERIDNAVNIFRNPNLCYIDLMRFERVAAEVDFVQLPNCLETTCDASCSCGYCGGPDECLRSCDDPSLAWVAAPVVVGTVLLAALIAFIVVMCKRGDCSCDCFCTLSDPIELEPPEPLLPMQDTAGPRKASQVSGISASHAARTHRVSFAEDQPQQGVAAGNGSGRNHQQQQQDDQRQQPRMVMPPPRVAKPLGRQQTALNTPSSPAAPSAIRLPRLRPQGQRPQQGGMPGLARAPPKQGSPKTPRKLPPIRSPSGSPKASPKPHHRTLPHPPPHGHSEEEDGKQTAAAAAAAAASASDDDDDSNAMQKADTGGEHAEKGKAQQQAPSQPSDETQGQQSQQQHDNAGEKTEEERSQEREGGPSTQTSGATSGDTNDKGGDENRGGEGDAAESQETKAGDDAESSESDTRQNEDPNASNASVVDV